MEHIMLIFLGICPTTISWSLKTATAYGSSNLPSLRRQTRVSFMYTAKTIMYASRKIVCDFFATMFTPKFLRIYIFIIEPGNAIRWVSFSFFFSVTSKPCPVIIRSLHATCKQHPRWHALLCSNMAEAAGLEATEILSCVRGYHVYCKIWTPYTVKKEVLL